MVMVCPLRPRCARPPLPKGEARDAHTVHQKVCRGGASAVERSGTSALGVPRPEHGARPAGGVEPLPYGQFIAASPFLRFLLQLCQHMGEFLRQGAGQLHELAGAGVDEAQAGGVEALARQAGDGLLRAVHRVA